MSPAELIKNGFALIPIPIGKKGPEHKHWNIPGECVRDLRDCFRLAGQNVGIAHAYCTPTPTCAIDIDNFLNAKAWLRIHGIDLESLLIASDAVVIASGKKFSLKLLYRLPTDSIALESKKIDGPDGKCALEFRCATKDGKTVQDLLPPSTHPGGYQYKWVGNGDPSKPSVIPKDLLNVWKELVFSGCCIAHLKSKNLLETPVIPETPRQVATLKNALLYINADCSYENWRNIVWAILSTGWTCAEVIAEAWSRTAANRYEDKAFWLLVNSYMPNHSTPISVGTIYHHARLGGWNA